MYSYHGRIRQRIRAGELVRCEFVDDYPHIGRALVLHFNTFPPVRPIRPHRWKEYEILLGEEVKPNEETGENEGENSS